jgi:hypothetical protein
MNDSELIKLLKLMQDNDLRFWLEDYLNNLNNLNPTPPYSPYEKHLYLILLFQKADNDFHKKILFVLEEILESYNP